MLLSSGFHMLATSVFMFLRPPVSLSARLQATFETTFNIIKQRSTVDMINIIMEGFTRLKHLSMIICNFLLSHDKDVSLAFSSNDCFHINFSSFTWEIFSLIYLLRLYVNSNDRLTELDIKQSGKEAAALKHQ